MKRTNLSSLKTMSAKARASQIASMLEATRSPPNGEVAAINGRLRAFEQQHDMTTSEMMDRVQSGAMRETEEICRWLMLAHLRARLVAASPRAR